MQECDMTLWYWHLAVEVLCFFIMATIVTGPLMLKHGVVDWYIQKAKSAYRRIANVVLGELRGDQFDRSDRL